MEIIKEGLETKKKKLTDVQRDELAHKISSNFTTWDDDRKEQIETARRIMKQVYLQQGSRNSENKEDSWKADVRLNKPYSIKKAKKASLWREIWSYEEQMFETKGTNKETEENAKIQKAGICDALKKMKIGKQYDSAIDNLYDIGEMIFVTDWEQKSKAVKRKTTQGFVLQELSRIFNLPIRGGMKELKLPYYENARVRSISPFMFVFDHAAYELHDKTNWDSCQKIFKRFETIANIKTNDIYTLSKEQEDELKEKTEHANEENKETIDLIDKTEHGNKYEVLYAHGDFIIGGITYKNYVAEVLAGKFLIRFEENPIFINPFILCALEYDPVTKRGISPLKAILNLCEEQEKMINTTIDMQQLALNPPSWINEELIDKDINAVNIYPGKLQKYKTDYNGGLPTAMTFGTSNLNTLIAGLDEIVGDVSGVNANMYGNITKTQRTAKELSLADRGAMSQVSKELDTINQDLTLPMIENIAELLAMFKDGIDVVYTTEKGKKLEFQITNEIRQAQYIYSYEDRNAILDRKSKFSEMYAIFLNIAQDPELRGLINWREVIETAVEMVGFDNTDKFFNQPTPLEQVVAQIKTAPPEIQEHFIQIIGNEIQSLQVAA